jgi:hypothetical protein|tara:strand:+ start:555 stop:785 length:231 start_codon:yes stop_codon:yes gene_type:complete
MTKQHPLTDEIIEKKIFESGQSIFDDIRSAYDEGADWQLEQVIEWLEETEYDQYWHNKILYTDDLKKAMRPQEDNS